MIGGLRQLETVIAHYAPMCALASARIGPAIWNNPLWGGSSVPATVRTANVLVLSLAAVQLHPATEPTLAFDTTFLAALCTELCLGVTLGFFLALPFSIASGTGAFVDYYRGASSDTYLPTVRAKESTTSAFLIQTVQLVLLLGAWSHLAPQLIGTFRDIPISSCDPTLPMWAALHRQVIATIWLALTYAAPVVISAATTDFSTAVVARFFPSVALSELAPPLRLLGIGMCWSTIWRPLVSVIARTAPTTAVSLGCAS